MCTVDQVAFEALIKNVKAVYGAGFSKNYREMPDGEFVKNVTDEMERWMFLKRNDDTDSIHQIKLCPLIGKIQGNYPKDYI